MSSLIGKRIGGQTYYYLREVARVGGKPKIVSQRYLGKAGDIAAAMEGTVAVPERTRHLAFGDVAAAWSVIERLGVAAIIDEVTGSRRVDAAASAGTYLALATLNRVVAPCSKLAFADWWATTAADRWVKVPAAALDHRRFWDAMDLLPVPQLAGIERRIGQAMAAQFALDLSGLVLDMTNFATFIDSANEKAPIAQRGKAKQKRNDLRLVGLGLVVTRDGGIPVVSRAYPGNRPDVTQFTAVIDELVTRYQGLGGSAAELTVTFDAGNDSAANQDHLAGLGLHYVASLPPSPNCWPSLPAATGWWTRTGSGG
jgi:transposase